MDEAERLCDHIAIMDAGRIVASGTPAALVAANTGAQRVRFTAHPEVGSDASPKARPGAGAADGDPGAFGWLAGVPHVHSVDRRGGSVEVVGEGAVLAHVAAALLARGLEPADLRVERPTLEETFLKLTGHALE